MQTLFQAGFVSIDGIEGALVVGFADRELGTSRYFMLQRALDPGDDDGVYLERDDQAFGSYGRVESCSLSRGRIEMTVDDATAASLGTEASFAVDLWCDQERFHRLQEALERIFAGTDCRFQAS